MKFFPFFFFVSLSMKFFLFFFFVYFRFWPFFLFYLNIAAIFRDMHGRGWPSYFYNTCYAIIYKSILNAYICDKLGYALMYILLYQSHIFIIAN